MTTKGRPPDLPLKYLTLGWGVQSFTIACMSALEELPRLDVAIHADTGHEHAGTYAQAAKWTPWLQDRGINVVTVKADNTDTTRKDWGTGSVMIPAFTLGKSNAAEGQVKRQCTKYWKIIPMRHHIRTMLPIRRPAPGSVESWQGISWDEADRMRSSDVKYITNVYPLVELRMTRMDCISWLQKNDLEVLLKSSCTFCPYHTTQQWRDLKKQDETTRKMPSPPTWNSGKCGSSTTSTSIPAGSPSKRQSSYPRTSARPRPKCTYPATSGSASYNPPGHPEHHTRPEGKTLPTNNHPDCIDLYVQGTYKTTMEVSAGGTLEIVCPCCEGACEHTNIPGNNPNIIHYPCNTCQGQGILNPLKEYTSYAEPMDRKEVHQQLATGPLQG